YSVRLPAQRVRRGGRKLSESQRILSIAPRTAHTTTAQSLVRLGLKFLIAWGNARESGTHPGPRSPHLQSSPHRFPDNTSLAQPSAPVPLSASPFAAGDTRESRVQARGRCHG